jgi:hypothetical protein
MSVVAKWKWFLLAVIVVAGLAALRRAVRGTDILDLRAADVPLRPVVLENGNLTDRFPESFSLQVAVLLTRDEGAFGVVHAFREMGIPFFVTHDLHRAVQHHLVLICPWVDSKTFTEEQAQTLTRFVESGGVVYADDVFWGALKPLFGFHNFVALRTRHWVSFGSSQSPLFKYLKRPDERRVRLGSSRTDSIFTTNGYESDGTPEVVARFEDGSAALLAKTVGRGKAYLSGVQLEDTVLRGQINRNSAGESAYVNTFDPGADVWMLILRAWYEDSSPDAIRLATIPNGQRSVLMLSHDVDWDYSVPATLEFAAMEKRHHDSATYFMQTKYVSDANSRAFFYGHNLDDLRQLRAEGFDLGSHSVIHSRQFDSFPLGTGQETYVTYRPHALSPQTAQGGTVLGEVRVSKELLDGEIAGQHTIFFRSGHLKFPSALPDALERCGYEFDSSFTAPDVRTNFPYVLMRDRGFEQESAIYEFPITIEDEASPLAGRTAGTLDVIAANADQGAPSVILIHTNDPDTKIAAEATILDRLPADIAVSNLTSFARFWRARDRLDWRVEPSHNPSECILRLKSNEQVNGLTFEFNREIARVDGEAVQRGAHQIVLPDLTAGQTHTLHVRYRLW